MNQKHGRAAVVLLAVFAASAALAADPEPAAEPAKKPAAEAPKKPQKVEPAVELARRNAGADVSFEVDMGVLAHQHEVAKFAYAPNDPNAAGTGTGTGTSTSGATAANYNKTVTTDGWNGTSTFPVLKVTMRPGAFVVAGEVSLLLANSSLIAGAFYAGRTVSHGVDVGLYCDMGYQSNHSNTSVDSSASTSTTTSTTTTTTGSNTANSDSAQATRNLAIGPYAQMQFGNALEVRSRLMYLHDSTEDSQFRSGDNSRTGFGVAADIFFLVPLSQHINYVAGLNFEYDTYNSGTKYEQGNSAVASGSLSSVLYKGSLSSDTSFTYGVTLLGIRARI